MLQATDLQFTYSMLYLKNANGTTLFFSAYQ